MNIKGATSTIMSKVFTIIAVLGFFVLACAVDLGEHGIKNYLIISAVWLICVFIAVALYDFKLIMRHVFAIYSIASLLNGAMKKKRDKKHMFYYSVMIDTKSIFRFYSCMLHMYDAYHSRKDN